MFRQNQNFNFCVQRRTFLFYFTVVSKEKLHFLKKGKSQKTSLRLKSRVNLKS